MSERPAPVGAEGRAPEIPERVFVTGANGFLGRALMARYRELGAEVRGMDVRADPEWNVVAGDLGEAGAWQQHAAGEIVCTVVRPADVYGPGSRPWVLIPLEMIKKGLFFLPAHGEGLFSPVYIDDLVDGIVLAAGLPAGAGQIFNLLGVEPVPAAEFFSYHQRWAGRSGPPRSFSSETAIAIAAVVSTLTKLVRRPMEVSPQTMRMLSKAHPMSGEKARKLLGYQPRVDLAEGMRRTEAWLREQGLIAG